MDKLICPKCNIVITGVPALSRKDNNTYICSECGKAEAWQEWENIVFEGLVAAYNKQLATMLHITYVTEKH